MTHNLENNYDWLCNWFYNLSDEDKESKNRIQIDTLANPGWFLRITTEETVLQNREFNKIFIERSEHDWIACKKENGVFVGNCGPFNFPEILQIFRDWVEKG